MLKYICIFPIGIIEASIFVCWKHNPFSILLSNGRKSSQMVLFVIFIFNFHIMAINDYSNFMYAFDNFHIKV